MYLSPSGAISIYVWAIQTQVQAPASILTLLTPGSSPVTANLRHQGGPAPSADYAFCQHEFAAI